jgi:hypothetical protein
MPEKLVGKEREDYNRRLRTKSHEILAVSDAWVLLSVINGVANEELRPGESRMWRGIGNNSVEEIVALYASMMELAVELEETYPFLKDNAGTISDWHGPTFPLREEKRDGKDQGD